jgi:creatinine amidohydrolase
VFADQRRAPVVNQLGAEFAQGGGHAGGYETSLVLAARPDLVRDDQRRGLPPNPKDLAAELARGATRAREIGGERAYFGFPAAATPAEGERLLDVLATMIVAAATSPLDGAR